MELQNITGLILLNKPLGLSSNAALQKVKRLFRAKKAGHTGSLDPLATGMLPICFGEATKFSQFLLESNKAYQVTVKLGEKTTTGDSEGEICERAPSDHITENQIIEQMQGFVGESKQTPPMYSALKYQGKPLYELARKGIEVKREPRLINIFEFSLSTFSKDDFTFTCFVKCSKGTYIRTLIEDLAVRLNSVAHVKGLHRLYVSPYENHTMVSFEELEKIQSQNGDLRSHLLPISSILNYPKINLTDDSYYYFRLGQTIRVESKITSDRVQVIHAEKLIGIGMLQQGFLKPERLIAQ